MFLNEARFGEISIISSSEDCARSIPEIVAYHIWTFLVAARGVTKPRPFLICSHFTMSYFRLWNSSFGRCRICQLTIIWERICIYYSHSRTYLEVSAHFPFALLYRFVFWNFIQLESSEVPRLGRLKLVAVKKYLSTAWTILSNCHLVAWAHWVVSAVSDTELYNIELNVDELV